jgi:hypothetical protein
MNYKQIRIGIDIGRVIIAPGDDSADTSFLRGTLDDALTTPPYSGAFETIEKLVTAYEGRVWLVSKAGPRTQEKTLRWLEHYRFHDYTGVARQNVVFCRQRHEKAVHCRAFQHTHFIDDRIQVLGYLRRDVENLYLFGEQKPGFIYPPWVVPALTWQDIRQQFHLD